MIENLTCNGYEVMLFHQGLGETCVFSQYIHAYRVKTGKSLLILADNPSRARILEQSPDIERVMECDQELFYKLAVDIEFREQMRIKNFMELYHLYRDERYAMMQEKVRAFLELSEDAVRVEYQLKSKNPMMLDQLFAQMNLIKGRTVFLVPFAVCYGNQVVPPNFWLSLAIRLVEEGYCPVFNSERSIIDGVPSVFLPMEEVPEFAEMCGNVIGVRTGLLDVIAAFCPVRMQVIHPNETCPIWGENKAFMQTEKPLEELVQERFNSYRIGKMFERQNTIEFIYHDETDVERLVKNVIS